MPTPRPRLRLLKLWLLSLLLSSSLTVQAQSTDFSIYNSYSWGINKFHADIDIQSDSSVTIKETITADFRSSQDRHGIRRNIPIQYKDKNGKNLDIRFSLISVTDEQGQPIETATSKEDGYISLRLGSPDHYVDGQIKTYQIKYQVKRVVTPFPDYDELYWNITGTEWDTAIVESSATIKIPANSNSIKNLQASCYTGPRQSREQNCQINVLDNQTWQIKTNQLLTPYNGLTAAVSFPKNIITYPDTRTEALWFLSDNWGYLIPLIVLLFLFIQWHKHGRDPQARHQTIMPEYDAPDGLSPAEIGTLLDDQADMRDITGTIIDLARRGYLKIVEIEKKNLIWTNYEYELEKTTPTKSATQLNKFEASIYKHLFEHGDKINLTDLSYKFYKHLLPIKNDIYNTLVDKQYYSKNPESVRTSYFTVGFIGLLVVLGYLGIISSINMSLYIGIVISFAMILLFGRIMPKKTQKGADTLIRIRGFVEFINTAEKDRLKFYEKENIFEKILPHAIALGLADKWAKACEGLANQPPTWYQSSSPNFHSHFNSWRFINTLNSFNANMSSNMQAAPRSSGSGGGGFSGGGFGGGGGSSW